MYRDDYPNAQHPSRPRATLHAFIRPANSGQKGNGHVKRIRNVHTRVVSHVLLPLEAALPRKNSKLETGSAMEQSIRESAGKHYKCLTDRMDRAEIWRKSKSIMRVLGT